LFTLAGRHKPSQGEHTLEVFKVEFTDLQNPVLTLLGVSKFALQRESWPGHSRCFASSSSAMEEMAFKAIEKEGSKGCCAESSKTPAGTGTTSLSALDTTLQSGLPRETT
jgi:hypothetical protein